jgi:hypothetical protein
MRQYRRQLEADERALEDDSSDDDDDESEDHVPLHWRNYDFSQCIVNLVKMCHGSTRRMMFL